MTLPTPILDDRSFDQLAEELKSRIGVYLPEWTDHGPSDPGVTLLELVAHLGESLLYRFNQIPDQTRLWLLRLMQQQPYPPRSATGLVAFELVGGATVPQEVFSGSAVYAGDLPFRVGNDVVVLPLATTTAIKATADAPADPVLRDEYQRVLDAADLDESEAQPYEEVVLAPEPLAPGFEPLDVRSSIDRQLWIAVHAADDEQVDATRSALLGAASPLIRAPLTLGFTLDDEFVDMDDVDPCEDVGGPPELQRMREQSAWSPSSQDPAAADGTSTLVWQVSVRPAPTESSTGYAPVTVVGDTTDSLRRSGTVSLRLPQNRLPDLGVATLTDPELAGVAAEPPALADGRPVLFWLRVFAREGSFPVGGLRWVGINAADVVQTATAGPELVGIGTGLSHQEYPLAQPPVVTDSVRIDTFEDESWVDWYVVDTFAASERGDRHVMVDGESGRVRCGDGVRGRPFPAGAQIRARSYDHGGGRAGLVGSGDIKLADNNLVGVFNPLPTTGGEDGESISSALERIPAELTRHDRAVTAGDFEALAKIRGVARTKCLPRFDPTTQALDAAGVVTVMVWPTEDVHHPDAPLPDTALLRAVCAHLDERRLVTTELFVVPPVYRPIAVSVGVGVKQGYSPLGVRRWVELVLRQYLSPLPPFGPDGEGWPLGHRVYAPELAAAAVQVEGVDFIRELKLADTSSGTPVIGDVDLQGWEVPALQEITVVQGEPPDPGSGSTPGSGPLEPPPGPAPVPVPVPKDEC
jgi:predicted phage baseplate assembly protein